MDRNESKVELRRHESETGEFTSLKAYDAENGDLVLEGYDCGEQVEAHWGDFDYEYWRRVKAVSVPRVLLELIKDRFTSDAGFSDWLKSKNIDCEVESW